MKSYHPYVFDEKTRTFVGRFEEMYRAERDEAFDSWHQDDLRILSRLVAQAVLQQFNFERILDVGCGKGAFTHTLKKRNNHVVAIDVSGTAIEVARGRYPDIEFIQGDMASPAFDLPRIGSGFDLVICMETLSYVERWRDMLARFAQVGWHALVVLYLPENPIGFVKTFDDLTAAFSTHFHVLDDIRLLTRRQIVLFGQALGAGEGGRR